MDNQDHSNITSTAASGKGAAAGIPVGQLPMGFRQYWIVFVASLGQMIGTIVATIAGVIIPLLNILLHPELSPFMQGLIGSVDLIGICIGATIFGKLSDKYGYLLFFRLCPALILLASVAAIFIADVWGLTICLFFVGLGIGGEYSLDSDYISELMPKGYGPLMVGVAKTASALGNIIASALCLWIIMDSRRAEVWPQLLWIIAGTAGLMLLLRIRFYQSPSWLEAQGKDEEARKAVKEFLGKEALPEPKVQTDETVKTQSENLFEFIIHNGKRVILSGIPWACEGLGVYGIGVFLPILVMALGLEHFTPGMPEVLHVAESVKVTLWISCIMLPGFILGLVLIRKKMRITAIQSLGFWLCAASLVILALSYHFGWNKWLSIGSFMAFELFLNMGPHLITYVLPPRIYPVQTRGQGVGLAASVGKIGAVLGVFLIPVLLKAGGAMLVLIVSAAVMAAGAIVTNVYGALVSKQDKLDI